MYELTRIFHNYLKALLSYIPRDALRSIPGTFFHSALHFILWRLGTAVKFILNPGY